MEKKRGAYEDHCMERGLYGSLVEGRKEDYTLLLRDWRMGEWPVRIIAWRGGPMAHWLREGKEDPMA